MLHKRKRPPAIAAIAFAAALVAAGPAALAATAVPGVTLDANGYFKLGIDLAVNLSDTLPPASGSVDVLEFPSSGPNSAGLHSYGSVDGNFGSRSSGYGVYDVTGSFRIVETITNTSGIAQNATFNFFITPGLLSNNIASALTGTDFVSAGLKFDIRRDGITKWDSSATLTTDTSGTSIVTGGSDTSLYSGSGTYYTVNGVNRSVDLGVLDAGASMVLSYQLDTFAKGSSVAGEDRFVPVTTYYVPDQWVTCGYGGYGGYGNECIPGSQVLKPGHFETIGGYTVAGAASSSHASSGDPFTIDFQGDPDFGDKTTHPLSSSLVLAPVPEPSTYALLLAGMGLVGWTARRRRTRTSSAPSGS